MRGSVKSESEKRNSLPPVRWTSKTKPRVKHVKLGVRLSTQIRTLERLLRHGPFQIGPYDDFVGAFLAATSPIMCYRLAQGGPRRAEASLREYRDSLIINLRLQKPWIRIIRSAD